ncbi:hypothetical protein SAMN05192558_102239 [Actinokineospora alba]|uniref:Uncharacterized protein n=1 Tax=Actinokineospora alba TaxID=504798 RepID=A0A1H0HTE6_9PSEU|nr:hypothetical protein [Actinokineospora alba]TDP64767.1 hypothetical protein C8E96_0239 [Actinokineospora alba]SDH45511.1 hypothetical protein SAMN05421871_10164 [Actinokineospora alba]SDO22061.1 hypothetical protein SAMN05192558_102239 [Actinokineospora alba]
MAVQPHEATNWWSIVRSRHSSDPVMPPMLARWAGRGTASHVVEPIAVDLRGFGDTHPELGLAWAP